MKNLFMNTIKAGLFSFACVMSCVSSATLMKTTMDFTIVGVNGDYSAVAVGNVFQFVSLYDNEGTYFDRSGATTECLSTHVTAADVDCNSTLDAGEYEYVSNMVTNMNTLYDLTHFEDDGSKFYDRIELDVSYTIASTPPNPATVFIVDTDSVYGRATFRPNDLRSTSLYYIDRSGNKLRTHIMYRINNINSVDVPEPSTLAIFALGMIGLASRRFKKQS